MLNSDSLKKLVDIEVQLATEEMFKNGLDTTQFSFIPVVLADLIFFKSGHISHPFLSGNRITLSEVLLISKKNGKTIGSYLACVDGFGSFVYVSSKHGLGTMPCRSNERLPYMNKSLYKKINKIKKRKGVLYILNIPESDKIYLAPVSGEIMEISP